MEAPAQIVSLPLMVHDGMGFTVVVTVADPVHPLALVTVTVKVAAVLTGIVCVVAPVDQL